MPEREVVKVGRNLTQVWLLCVVMLPAVAQAQFTFTTNTDGSLSIYQYTGSGGDVIIPDTTNGLPVTSIGDDVHGLGAFQFCTNLNSVVIPSGVLTIGTSAFNSCTSLTSVVIPNSITSIGGDAFYGCSGLTNITIPASVTGMGDGAFAFCASLNNVTIPNSITNLGDYAFYSCTSLTSATITTNITSIGISEFDSCASLTNVTIPNSVTNIGSSAFQNCASLGGVMIPASVIGIGNYAFDSCTNLTSIVVDPLNTNYSSVDGILFNLNQSTLIQCPGGKAGSYIIPNTVTNIGNLAFDSCAGLTNIVIPFSVRNIGESAFDSCTGLTILNIPNSVTNIGSWAFDSCSSLTSVSIEPFPEVENNYRGAAVIQEHTFEDCTGLTGVTIGPWVTKIMNFAFDDCTDVTGFYFQYNAPLTNNLSLFGNDNNATVYYHPGTTGWGPTFGGLPTAPWLFSYGFTFTTNNGTITITGYNGNGNDGYIGDIIVPDTTNGLPVTSIGVQAFYGCNGMTSITIPNSVTTFGTAAFYSCTRLASVYCLGNSPTPTDDSSAFLYDNNPTVYYLPGTTGWGATFDGVPTAPWMLPNPMILNFEPNFGVQTNQFGFTISWATNTSVVVEASTDLSNPVWTPVATNTLTDGASYFGDSQWTNYPGRFYRLRSP
jgi:hypothetical protein